MRSSAVTLSLFLALTATTRAHGQTAAAPEALGDRGSGLATSLFGTYVGAGELLVYPFYEYTRSTAFEYKPNELGFPGGGDFRGRTVEREALLFLAYGITDRLAVEVEAAHASISFEKAPNDGSTVPSRLRESGLGDVDFELRWRWNRETRTRPELFSYLEVTPPFARRKHLIGTQDWEAALGFGAIRAHPWGTLTARVAMAYDGDGKQVELGEYAVEYLKRVSERWRFVAALEGESDEVSLIGEAQWTILPNAFVKLNCGFGLTPRAPDLAPEIGILFRF